MDRRQSIYLSRLQSDPRAGMDAEAVDSEGRDHDVGISDRQSLGSRGPVMRVCVYGLWHLGTVTAACLASRKIATVGLAETREAAAELNAGKAPLFEPGLEALIEQGRKSGALTFTQDIAGAVSSADLIWVSFDTPVDDDDVADVGHVLDRVRLTFPYLKDGAVVLVSSQVPVGSTALLEHDFASAAKRRKVSFAYSPENLRLGDAIRVFTEPERIVIGIRSDDARKVIEQVLKPFRLGENPDGIP